MMTRKHLEVVFCHTAFGGRFEVELRLPQNNPRWLGWSRNDLHFCLRHETQHEPFVWER
jgi:hypothetical protein